MINPTAIAAPTLDESGQIDVTGLIDSWLKAEQEGEQFAVPFDMAWVIAGYARKDNAKKKLESFLEKGSDYSADLRNIGRGKPLEEIRLTCNALKELCMVSKTEQGKATRLYFIEAEKKWKLVQQHAPAIAQEINLIHAKQELAKLEAQKSQVELQLVQFRHIVTTTMPEPVQQKILGYTQIETVKYCDRVFHDEDLLNDGSTATKTELCHRYGLLTRNGKADYKRLNEILDKFPNDAFSPSVRFQQVQEFKRDWLGKLDAEVLAGDRALYIGEA